MTETNTKFVYVTFILAAPQEVFDAITRPEIAQHYWAYENVSDWKAGSRWEHVRANETRSVDLIGSVLENDPPKRLVISWARPSEFEDKDKHSKVTFDLKPYKNMVRLTVTHDELDHDEKMANSISHGWPMVLSSLKSYLETGKPIDVFAEPLSA